MIFVSARHGLARFSAAPSFNVLPKFSTQHRHVSINSGIARGLRAEGSPMNGKTKDRYTSPRKSNDTDFNVQPYSRPFPAQRTVSFTRPSDYAYEVKQKIPYSTAASQFLAGTRTITAALSAGRRRLYKLYTIAEHNAEVEKVQSLAKTKGIPVELVDEHAITARLVGIPGAARTPHEGVLLECSPIPELPTRSLSVYSSSQDTIKLELQPQNAEQEFVNTKNNIIAGKAGGWRNPVILWAHGVTDTGNLGALCRSALYFGVAAIAVTTRGSSAVTLATIKAGAGAPEFVPLLRVSDPTSFIRESQAQRWKFYAAVAPSTRRRPIDPADIKLNPAVSHPCVLVLGNEELGLPEDIIRKSDSLVSIPARSASATAAGIDSLNVSVAGAILAERFTRSLSDAEKVFVAEEQEKRIF